MLECKPIITNHILWHLGNGETGSFWFDSWNGLSRLVDLEEVEDLIPIMEAEWGETVDCYVEERQSEMVVY